MLQQPVSESITIHAAKVAEIDALANVTNTQLPEIQRFLKGPPGMGGIDQLSYDRQGYQHETQH